MIRKLLDLTALALAVVLTTAPTTGLGQSVELTSEQIYQKCVPSVLTITVKRADGSSGMGSAFMARNDGIAATAWHVVRGAIRVTAKTHEGEEFEVSGLIDRDEKRDLALVRVKVYGVPLLSLAHNDPPVGARAYVIGAPRALEFSISDGLISQIQSVDGGRYYQFTCAASPGNSGSPLLDSRGNVLGVVSWQVKEGQNLNFAIPARYVLGLDATLPTRAWSGLADDVPIAENLGREGDALDGLLADALVIMAENATIRAWVAEEVIRRAGGFSGGVPSALYSSRRDVGTIKLELSRAASDDTLRENVRRSLLRRAGAQEETTDLIINAIREAQSVGGWDAQANDLLARAEGIPTYLPEGPTTSQGEFRSLFKASRTFRERLPRDLAYAAGISDTTSALKLGVPIYPRDPLSLILVPKGSWAHDLGLRSGDRIVAAGGKTFSRASVLEDFKAVLLANLGQKVAISVERNGERVELAPKLPRKLPER